MTVKHPAIPEPVTDDIAVRDAILAIKQSMEILTKQKRGSNLDAAVTWQDLVDLELIAADQVPST